jgi:very-short-patch-repair endonuclease
VPRFDHSREQTARARALRRDMTRYERAAWLRLRGGALGASFRKQHPIGPYIADFAAPSLSLIVEIDGGQHGAPAGLDADQARDGFLAAKGWSVMRFTNGEVFENLDGVVETIWNRVQALKPGA